MKSSNFTDGIIPLKPFSVASVYTRLMEAWFIAPSAYDAMWLTVTTAAEHIASAKMGVFDDDDDGDSPRYSIGNDGVAVLPIYGPMARRPEWWEKKYLGIVAQGDIANEIDRALVDGAVRALVLDIDSPGGHAVGTPELAQKVADFGKKKACVAHTSGVMGSAAYYIGSHANAVLATGSAHVGCIGTVLSFLDISGWYEQMGVKREVITNEGATYKGMGIPGTSLTKEQRAFLQEQITKNGEQFKGAVRSMRPRVTDDAMRGQTLTGDDAVASGLVDQLGDMGMAKRTAQQLSAFMSARA